jgi:MFS transporter, OFA family, oxalate/formate antiporter
MRDFLLPRGSGAMEAVMFVADLRAAGEVRPAEPNRAWVVVLAAVGINLVLGTLYAWSVVGKALIGQWEWSKTAASWPFTGSTIAFALCMIFAGRMQDKLGPRLTATLGGVMFGSGLLLSAFARTPAMMVLTFGVIGGIGLGLCYSATTPPALKWFPPGRKGLIAGIVVSGVGIAPVYVSPLTAWLLRTTSIPTTFMILGIGAIVVIVAMAMLLTNPPAGYVAATAPAAAGVAVKPPAAVREMDWHEMLRTPQFWLLWLSMALSTSAGLMVIAHLATIAKVQIGWEAGFLAVVVLSLFNSAGRPIGGFFSDKIGRGNTMLLFFIVQAVNMAVFSLYMSPNALLFGAALTGLCYGTIFSLYPATTADLYGIRNLGVNYGFMFTAFGVAGVLGPITAGAIADATKSYNGAYVASAVLLVVGAVLAKLVRPRRTA